MKKVSNLLINIGKVQDILDTGDIMEIRKYFFLIEKVRDDILRQCKSYIKYDDHELDFNYHDLEEMSDKMFKIMAKCQKMQYKHLEKKLLEHQPITIEDFNKLCYAARDPMFFDRWLRPIANDLSFWAITIHVYSRSENKLGIMDMLTNTIRGLM